MKDQPTTILQTHYLRTSKSVLLSLNTTSYQVMRNNFEFSQYLHNEWTNNNGKVYKEKCKMANNGYIAVTQM